MADFSRDQLIAQAKANPRMAGKSDAEIAAKVDAYLATKGKPEAQPKKPAKSAAREPSKAAPKVEAPKAGGTKPEPAKGPAPSVPSARLVPSFRVPAMPVQRDIELRDVARAVVRALPRNADYPGQEQQLRAIPGEVLDTFRPPPRTLAGMFPSTMRYAPDATPDEPPPDTTPYSARKRPPAGPLVFSPQTEELARQAEDTGTPTQKSLRPGAPKNRSPAATAAMAKARARGVTDLEGMSDADLIELAEDM